MYDYRWFREKVEGVDGRLGLVLEVAMAIQGFDPAHGWPHVVRVARLAEGIVYGEGLDVDWRVLYSSVMLHDVGRSLQGSEHHAVKSARFARSLVSMLWGGDLASRVEHAILAHSYSLGVEPRSVEALVLRDADRLDALGAVGIARVFHTGCSMGRSFEYSIGHFYDKILKLKDGLYFEWSRREAEKRTRRVLAYLEWWKEEVGKDSMV